MSAVRGDVKLKLAMLEVAKELGNVSKACRLFGYSRDSFYRIRELYENGGEGALKNKPRTTPNVKNRVPSEVENQVMQLTLMQPRWGQVLIARELRRRGVRISPSGVRGIWVRHDLATIEKRLEALEPAMSVETPSETAILEPTEVDD